jgi:hypothetical protein
VRGERSLGGDDRDMRRAEQLEVLGRLPAGSVPITPRDADGVIEL